MDAAHRKTARQEAGHQRKKKPAGAMRHTAGLPGWRPGGSAKKQPAGAMDGPAGVKKWRGQDSNL